MPDWMLYGTTGYTGELIAREAVRRGMRPLLAGRDAAAVGRLAGELGCQSRTFALSDAVALPSQLAEVRLVLNCAGPFSATAAPLMEACLRAGVHYLDITGELAVIEAAAALSDRAKAAGVALIPAVGFDVVPSDCLAAILAARLPSATRLQLAFKTLGGLSPGTTKTMLEALPQGGRVRIEGRITRVPLAWKTHEIPFADGTETAVTIPWGDVASAFYSTGIGNIEVYTTLPPGQLRALRWFGWAIPLLGWGPFQRWLQGRVAKSTRGPTGGDRAKTRASLWGRVEDASGQSAAATLTTPNGYDLTVLTALASVERVLAGDISPGFHTPSLAFGREFILTLPGTEYREMFDKV